MGVDTMTEGNQVLLRLRNSFAGTRFGILVVLVLLLVSSLMALLAASHATMRGVQT